MGKTALWSFGGGPNSLSYRLFDALRNVMNRQLASYLYNRIGKASHGRLRTLEAGSGPGYCSSLIAPMEGVAHSTILDLDQDALDLASSRDKRIRIVQGDLYHLPFQDDSFDLVFNSSTMEHLSFFQRSLHEIVRVTKPDGKIFVGVPYKYGPFMPFNLLPEAHPISEWMGKLYTRRGLTDACRTEGLIVEDRFIYFGACFVGVLLTKTDKPTFEPQRP